MWHVQFSVSDVLFNSYIIRLTEMEGRVRGAVFYLLLQHLKTPVVVAKFKSHYSISVFMPINTTKQVPITKYS